MTFTVAGALDAYVQANASIREPDQKWHPSSIFSCARKAIYEYRGEEQSNPKDARSGRVLFVGTQWHEIVQAAVNAHGEVDEVYTEVPIDLPDLNIVGHADQLVRIGDRWELLEFKSISSRGFSYLKGQPKPEHVEQAMVYLYAIRTAGAPDHNGWVMDEHGNSNIPPLGDALDRVRFVYISKDDLRIAEFTVHFTPEMEQSMRDRIALLNVYAEDPLSLPPRLPLEKGGKKNWLCAGYCEFRDRCWNVDAKEVPPDPDIY